ncbi:MAG TPA: glycosyl transferase family 36 [Ignavibacteriaceae bacterium]|nr:glycosyl transferase family 36 [Ignavibacteriaceae bacterium]
MNNFKTKYGFFSDDGNEYIITDIQTPKPWVNVISNGDYGLVISQTGGGFSWKTHSELNRLNRWHQDLIQDNWGKYFYFRNNNTGEIWNPLWMPVKTDITNYECRYGFGYAVFKSSFKGIDVTLRVFVPVNDNLEIWNFSVENKTGKKLNLSIISYFEWCLGTSSDFHREFHKAFIETHFEDNILSGTKRLWEIPLGDRGHWNIEYGHFGFITSDQNISEFEVDKEKFIGQYGDLKNPQAIRENKYSNKTSRWLDPVGVVRVDLEINSSAKQDANFYLGIVDHKKDIRELINKYIGKEAIDYALDEVKENWKNILGTLEINTPDDAMNLLVNKWLRYQAISGRLWARTAYYQQSGAFGFRDQLQDSLVYLPINPERTKQQIKLHARHQFEDGTVLHWWHPISDTGLETKMTDDLLWLPFLILEYIKETSDYSILDETEHYYNSKKTDSLLNHCIASIEKVLTRLSTRGLALIGAGDWNDGLSAVGLNMKGESIWLTQFLYYILSNFADLLQDIDKEDLSEKYNQKAAELQEAFNKYAWDGEYYFGATKDSGEKILSSECEEGKVYLNTQTWSVISEIAPKENQLKAMDAVEKYLLKDFGTLLLHPAYSKPDKFIGYLTRYAPGRRENGGTYTHAATWSVWAYSILKENDLAYTCYKKISPIDNGMNPDKYVAEPYVTPGNIEGPDSPLYGMAGWTWYTGSAAWLQKVVVERILGVRAVNQGLLIDPCVPKDWKEYSVRRMFRLNNYNIKFICGGSSNRVDKIIVNGKEQKSNLIEPQCESENEIIVYLK